MRRNSSAKLELGLGQAGRQKDSGRQRGWDRERRKGHLCEKANVSVLLFLALGTYVWPTSITTPAIRMKSNPQPKNEPKNETHLHRHALTVDSAYVDSALVVKDKRIKGVNGVALLLSAQGSSSNQEHLSASVLRNQDKRELTKEKK